MTKYSVLKLQTDRDHTDQGYTNRNRPATRYESRSAHQPQRAPFLALYNGQQNRNSRQYQSTTSYGPSVTSGHNNNYKPPPKQYPKHSPPDRRRPLQYPPRQRPPYRSGSNDFRRPPQRPQPPTRQMNTFRPNHLASLRSINKTKHKGSHRPWQAPRNLKDSNDPQPPEDYVNNH